MKLRWWTMIVAVVAVMLVIKSAMSDPQTESLLVEACSQYSDSNIFEFFRNFNSTLADIRRDISVNKTHWTTQQQARTTNPVYTTFQCRNYLSTEDCLACFDKAAVDIRAYCKLSTGGRVGYDGCYLRYAPTDFYAQSAEPTIPQVARVCGDNQTKLNTTAFTSVVQGLISDLVTVTPKINGFFAATTRPLFSGGANKTVYAVGQCLPNLSPKDCQYCLTIGYNNLRYCPPASEGSTADSGCFLRYSETSFFPNNSIIDIIPYLRGQVGGTSGSKKTIIVGAIGGSCLLLLILPVLIWYQFVRKQYIAQRGDEFGLSKLQGPVIYHFKDLKSATRSFSEDTKIGEGGFGDVYKGITKNGIVVAIKKLSIVTKKEKADFGTEVRLISNVNHRNIIRLLGCSARGSVLLLVFEYMANGSLDTFLYGEKRGSLSWKHRVDIILGIARGLVYLHEQFHLCIIHRDIKPSNILLDDDFQPKISDFGLARLMRDDQSHISTRFAGTSGYTAPEYAIHGHLSEKVDTYSFGVVVLEIVSGRRCTNLTIEPVNGSLLVHAWNLFEKDMHLDLVDETLDPSEYSIDDVKKIVETALMCTQSPTSVRPTMSEVVVLLTNDRSVDQKPPDKPIFF